MQTPPLPQGDPGRPTPPEPESLPINSRLEPIEHASSEPPKDPESDSAATVDLFLHSPSDADEAPTVISKGPPPRPTPADELPGASLRGRRLAHFELIEPIGVGGMAAVIRAHDTQLDRSVALKILPPEMAGDAENVRRFHQEARSAAKLDHENIARVFFCGEDQKLHFIAFEFVEGENLRTLLERRGRLPVQEALHYVLQVASGLMHAAARGVVHRDIKPSNIIISPNGRAKLVDMGLARMEGPHAEEGLTQSGVTLGTFDYISPEQALEPREADVRSDIYSLGCTLYHMLTGQPPVPDGTAAKKLHHHQHVPPVDPRQLNPDIPDEVAAILGRMMAKDPKARYQHAEHLVQHLILAAQKTGTFAPGTPDGVLFVDTPLPSPPRTRPLLVAGLGAVILVTLILIFGQGRTPWSGGSRDAGWASFFPPQRERDRQADRPTRDEQHKDPVQPKDAGSSEKAREKAIRYEPKSAEDLVAFLRKADNKDRQLEIVLSRDIELPVVLRTSEDQEIVPYLAIRGKKVTIRAKMGTHPTIRVSYDPDRLGPMMPGMDAPRWQGLSIESDDVTVQGIDFVVDGKDEAERMVGLVLRNATSGKGQFRVGACSFYLVGQRTDLARDRPSALIVEASRDLGEKPQLTLEDCYFVCAEKSGQTLSGLERSGQDAVTLKTPVKVQATNCAFAPHCALFRMEGTGQSEIEVRHCSGLLKGESAVFHLAGEGTTCKFDVEHSVWSGQNRATAQPVEWKGAVLIRQEGSMAGAVRFHGYDNRYHDLDALWVRSTAPAKVMARDLAAFKSALDDLGNDDSTELASAGSPWKELDPLKALERRDPKAAFVVQPNVKELRSAEDPKRWLVGLKRCAWGGMFDKLPELGDGSAVARNERIVDPDAKEYPARVYRSLGEALAAAKAGEVILLRFNGPRSIDPVRLETEAHRNLTIRAHPDFHPILTLGDTREQNAFLFRVHDVELTLEDLGFRLQPNKDEFKSQTVAELVGKAACTMKRCVVTLDSNGKSAGLAVATIANPGAVMKMSQEDGPSVARLRCENCLIRGKGDLLAARAGRPLDLAIDNSLVALDGSCLEIDNKIEGSTPIDPKAKTVVTLQHVTTYLSSHLVKLRAVKDYKGVVPVRVDASDCLFMSVRGSSLVHLDGPELVDEKMKQLFTWKGTHNTYWNFSQYLDRPERDDVPSMALGLQEWRKFTSEETNTVKMIPGDRPVDDAVPMHRVTALGFKVNSDLRNRGYGAVLDAVAAPAGETKPPRPPRDED
jgi:hypothetical protein